MLVKRREHKYKTVGPGIPACTCGEVFEWKYEFEDHKNRWEYYYDRTEKTPCEKCGKSPAAYFPNTGMTACTEHWKDQE